MRPYAECSAKPDRMVRPGFEDHLVNLVSTRYRAGGRDRLPPVVYLVGWSRQASSDQPSPSRGGQRLLCSEFQLVKSGDGWEDIKPLPCERWSCNYCAPFRRLRLIAQAASGEPNKILTLTVNAAVGNNPTERRAMLHDAWKRLVKRILRRYKWKRLPYMAFIEKTQKGEPHLHILLRCDFIPQRWISAQMKDMIGSPIVWIEQVKGTGKAIAYVTKYVGKAPAQFGTAKRYWMSRDWIKLAEDRDARPIMDMRDIIVRRKSWSETLAEHNSPYYEKEVLEDGWTRYRKLTYTTARRWRHMAPFLYWRTTEREPASPDRWESK
jgi:hypothetical protein